MSSQEREESIDDFLERMSYLLVEETESFEDEEEKDQKAILSEHLALEFLKQNFLSRNLGPTDEEAHHMSIIFPDWKKLVESQYHRLYFDQNKRDRTLLEMADIAIDLSYDDINRVCVKRVEMLRGEKENYDVNTDGRYNINTEIKNWQKINAISLAAQIFGERNHSG